MLQRLAILVMLILTLWTVSTSIDTTARMAFACSCAEQKPPLETLGDSAAVFRGRVMEIKTTSGDGHETLFNVSKTWKGVSDDDNLVTVATSGNMCGYWFQNDNEYLVYAYERVDGQLTTNICSRTHLIEDAEADLAALGEGRDVGKSLVYSPEIWSYPNPFLLAGIAAGIGGAIAAGVLITRRRRE
jgi:hypothetical protein